ncbi:MAG: lactate racemase domain-containing protein [Spirochaetaceae bacterium]|jgi:nickel-dependent lactate racemase|nr:lactate racemase domain-containing protein [Spirochaetaceae bacterium]
MLKTYCAVGAVNCDLDDRELADLFSEAFVRAEADCGAKGRVLVLPPDGTRAHSKAGYLTDILCTDFGSRVGAVMPALGTHSPMTEPEIRRMFPRTPPEKFRVHNWRKDVARIGEVEADWVAEASEGAVRYEWPVQVNNALIRGGYSLIVSLGQVVPHEVAGMANHAKNIFVGTGGKEAIDKSHFLGASYGMERMMGKVDTPVRALFDEGMRRFERLFPPILWVLTVIGVRTDGEAAATGSSRGSLAVRGLYIGFGRDCFEKAARLSQEVNITRLAEPIGKAVVFLDPTEYRTTWLGNKAVYRTRMAMAEGGELVILAPGLERFGEDAGNDALIRAHGYRPARVIKEKLSSDAELSGNLSAAAHLIHGSSEGRFLVRYCPGGGVSRAEIEAVGYEWGNLDEALSRYEGLRAGWNATPSGERVFFIPNPALGLWSFF